MSLRSGLPVFFGVVLHLQAVGQVASQGLAVTESQLRVSTRDFGSGITRLPTGWLLVPRQFYVGLCHAGFVVAS